MASFLFPPRSIRPPPLFQKPRTLITFSYDSLHELHIGSNEALRYFQSPPPEADLNYRFDHWVHKVETKPRLDSLLKCLGGSPQAVHASNRPSVVTWRGIMTKILTAPTETREGWELNAMLIGPLLCLEEHITEAKLRAKNKPSMIDRENTYRGYAFESWCTRSDADGLNGTSSPGWGGDVNTNVQHCHVVKTKLGSVRLIMGGEVDCCREQYNGETDCLMELKTSVNLKTPIEEHRFEEKLLRFWAQSYLLGIPEVLVGFRGRTGELKTIQSFQTLDIPRMARENRAKRGDMAEIWDAGYALEFAERFLSFLGQEMSRSQANPSDVWRLKMTPQRGIEVRKLTTAEELHEVHGGEDRVGFVERDWFLSRTRAQTGQ
ncbi:RAI1-domain-containing protein [Clavulina sp. PMI_390]|nr:RAI1-domain-containing protein [Clavulina sp. PMI_390]